MNNWHNDFMAEYHRQQILDETFQIHLERIAVQSRVYRPGLFERAMYSIATWMITTGKQLRKRYESPATDCSRPRYGSYAH